MAHHFLAYLYRLQNIGRWSLMRNTTEENVAEHSYHVALLSHVLCTVARDIFGKEVDPDRAASYALFHDATEVFTGDIPTPVKHHNPRILANFREIEALAAERLLNTVPDELREAYRPLVTGVSADPELTRYVKAADLLDAYLKCLSEMTAGNREFATAGKQNEEKLRLLGMPEVDWLLERLAPSFRMTVDELSDDEPPVPEKDAPSFPPA
jgi:5'-deoxynucleotidase